jgi:hypothetical protein
MTDKKQEEQVKQDEPTKDQPKDKAELSQEQLDQVAGGTRIHKPYP